MAADLVAGDTNGTTDIFVHDRSIDSITRVSVSSAGLQGNGFSGAPDISADGRYVVFSSGSTNLVANDTNSASDIFRHDMQTGVTIRVSMNVFGQQVSGASSDPRVSGDGRLVAFVSASSTLTFSDSNGVKDVFVKDLVSGDISLESVSTLGSQAEQECLWPAISDDGRFLVFSSTAVTLVPNDSNGVEDVFVRDRQLATTLRASSNLNGNAANGRSERPDVSGDGSVVIFQSLAPDLVTNDLNGLSDIFSYGLSGGALLRLPGSDGGALARASVSGDQVSFESSIALVSGDTNGKTDIFVRDMNQGVTQRVSVSSQGAQANGHSSTAVLSADGRLVSFASKATNLVAGGTAKTQVFQHETIGPFVDLGFALAGTHGAPSLTGQGTLQVGTLVTFQLSNALESATAYLVLGLSIINAPFKGGVLVPAPDLLLPLATDASGDIVLSVLWPSGGTAGSWLALQYWIQDAAGPLGFAASNGLKVILP